VTGKICRTNQTEY